MAILSKISTPTENVGFGTILKEESGASITVLSSKFVDETFVQIVKVAKDAVDSFENKMRAHAGVEITEQRELGDEILYTVIWEPIDDPLIREIARSEAELLGVEGSGETVTLKIQFQSQEDYNNFRKNIRALETPIDFKQALKPTPTDTVHGYGLTAKQRKTLKTAFEAGYFEIPRRATTKDLANGLGISDQAVTERIRRGISNLLENTMLVN